MKRIVVNLYILSLLFFLPFFELKAEDWELVKNKDGVEVFMADLPDSDLKHIQLRSIIKGKSLSSFVALFQDVKAYQEWIYGCNGVVLLKQISETEIIYYTRADFPWPFDDRGFVVHNRVWQDSISYAFHSKTVASEYQFALDENVVRVSDFDGEWVITPLVNGDFSLCYTFKIDPELEMPAWLVNYFLDIGPVKTIQNIETIASERRYTNVFLPHIKELNIVKKEFAKKLAEPREGIQVID